MSMNLITLEQLIGILLAYLFISILLPAFVLGKTLNLRNRFEKFLIYSTFGNFYAINLVYYLELMHISNRFTLIAFTLIPCFAIKIWLEKIPVVRNALDRWETLRRIAGGQLSLKAWNDAKKPLRKERIQRIRKHLFDVYCRHYADVILLVLFFAGLAWIFGTNLFQYYGYKASDVVVHNLWINSLSDNKIFVTGVYPYGFHCMCYYLHTVFNIDTVAILRLFAFAQTVWVYMTLLCFLKTVLKAKYLPYIGAFTYLLADFYRYNTYYRFVATLPQEYGMIFILPGIYALLQFFREQRREDRGDKSKKTKVYLLVFAMAFSLTLTIHFYGTAIVGLYCLAIAIGFIKWFIQGKYFKKIMLTGIKSIIIAILPMVIAFSTGTELQGSLYWGLGIITGQDYFEEDDSEEPEEEEVVTEPQENEALNALKEEYGSAIGSVIYDVESVKSNMDDNVLEFDNRNYAYLVMILPLILLIVSGFVFYFAKERDPMYGATLLSSGIFSCFIVIMLNAYLFHLPSIMDMNRGGIYFSYISTICIVMIMDGIIYLATYACEKQWVKSACSFALVAALLIYIATHGGIRESVHEEGQEMNEAVECLTHILRDEEPFMWTIVSANDERQMACSKGFHSEIIEFLGGMEYYSKDHRMMIPTPTVYFFVEKRPVKYNASQYDESQRISEEAANNQLPLGQGIASYQGENRMIVMSRMYEWCQAFSKLYPNEVTVFMDTDNFICYRIEQNPYRLFNFAIDYDYNSRKYPVKATGVEKEGNKG